MGSLLGEQQGEGGAPARQAGLHGADGHTGLLRDVGDRQVRDVVQVPVAAYQVSGEYAMIEAAAAAGYLDRRAAILEALTSIRRAGADIVIHSAATVSFDSPLTSAVEINLLGPSRIAQLCQDLQITPHLVAVSTCYVAGNRRGSAPEQLVSEGPFDIGLDWRAEVTASRRLKGDTEATSRTPECSWPTPTRSPARSP